MEKKILPQARTAALLSFIFNGLGQIYNGQIKKGLWLFFGSGVCLLLFLLGAVLIGYLCTSKTLFLINQINPALIWGIILLSVGIIGIVVIGIYSITDAFKTAQKSENNQNPLKQTTED